MSPPTTRRRLLRTSGSVVALGVPAVGVGRSIGRASADGSDGDSGVGADDRARTDGDDHAGDGDDAFGREAWPSYQYDRTNAGYGSTVRGPVEEPHPRWRFDLEGTAGPPTVAEGTVFVHGEDTLYAIDAGDGEERWRFETEIEGRLQAPAVAGRAVYFGTHRRFYSLDAEDGSERWRNSAIRSARDAVVSDGVVYATGAPIPGDVYAIDAADGTLLWHRAIPSGTPPTTDGEGVYFGGGDAVFALDAATGEHRWTFESEGGVEGVVPKGSVAYVATSFGYLHAIGAGGEERWRWGGPREGEFGPLRSPTAASDGVCVPGQANLYGIDAGGEQRWRSEPPFDSPVTSSVAPVAGGVAYQQTRSRYRAMVRAVNAADGRELWRLPIDERAAPFVPPAIADRTLYLSLTAHRGGNDAPDRVGYVYALDDVDNGWGPQR